MAQNHYRKWSSLLVITWLLDCTEQLGGVATDVVLALACYLIKWRSACLAVEQQLMTEEPGVFIARLVNIFWWAHVLLVGFFLSSRLSTVSYSGCLLWSSVCYKPHQHLAKLSSVRLAVYLGNSSWAWKFVLFTRMMLCNFMRLLLFIFSLYDAMGMCGGASLGYTLTAGKGVSSTPPPLERA